MKLEIDEISKKRQKLHELRIMLKQKFFGIDIEIDKVVDSLETWYVMPEIITHPIIINLWSLTGNGKTDLVRTIVDFLGFSQKFCEIQLSDTPSDGENKGNKIANLVLSSGCKQNEPGIILLDEFQRYRTITGLGEDVKGLPYQDIWLLLSDGKFPVDDKKEKIFWELNRELGYDWREIIYDEEGNTFGITDDGNVEVIAEKGPKVQQDYDIEGKGLKNRQVECDGVDEFTVGDKTVRSPRFKPNRPFSMLLPRTTDKSLENQSNWYSNPVDRAVEYMDYTVRKEDIANMTYLTLLEKIKEYRKNRTATFDFVQSLIFVCGNLDEAYQMAGSIDDCDTDADVFHSFTKRISIIEIKSALATRFKPEQISRLGNNHVIYPSLTKDAYMKIIERSCRKYLDNASKVSGLEFDLDQSVVTAIYENAVFPTQGTRPVFSSIHMMFGSPLSGGILWALEKGHKKINVKIEPEASCLTFEGMDKSTHCIPIQFQLRDRKDRNTENFEALVSVHEVGHAILHSHLFKTAPKEIKINAASFTGGYNLYETKFNSSSAILDSICVSFGGIVAEELIFGKENRASGSVSDLMKATKAAAGYIRSHGMDDTIGFILPDAAANYVSDLSFSNARIEQILQKEKQRARDILISKKEFLLEFSKDLLKKKSFSQEEFMEYAKAQFDFTKTPVKDDYKIDTTTDYYNLLMYGAPGV